MAALRDVTAVPAFTLDVAPTKSLQPLISRFGPGPYLGLDVDPTADGREVDVVASLTGLPFYSGSIGFIVCYHVLEHVPDDAAAMREIARVLSPDGISLVQVPWRTGQTDEDPTASAEERVRRFGQADHVRYYGEDFVLRLEDAGLTPLELSPRLAATDDLIALCGLQADEKVWVLANRQDSLPSAQRVREALLRAEVRLLASAIADIASEAKRSREESARKAQVQVDAAHAERSKVLADLEAIRLSRSYRLGRAARLAVHPRLALQRAKRMAPRRKPDRSARA